MTIGSAFTMTVRWMNCARRTYSTWDKSHFTNSCNWRSGLWHGPLEVDRRTGGGPTWGPSIFPRDRLIDCKKVLNDDSRRSNSNGSDLRFHERLHSGHEVSQPTSVNIEINPIRNAQGLTSGRKGRSTRSIAALTSKDRFLSK